MGNAATFDSFATRSLAAHLGSKQTTHLSVTVLLFEISGSLSFGDSTTLLHVGITWEFKRVPATGQLAENFWQREAGIRSRSLGGSGVQQV